MDYHQDQQLLPANGIGRFQLDQPNSWRVDLFVNQGVIFGFFLKPFFNFLFFYKIIKDWQSFKSKNRLRNWPESIRNILNYI